MTYAERAANACIGVERADLVLAGCAILEAIRGHFPAERIRIADRGLREGMLMQMMRADRVLAARARRCAEHDRRQFGSRGRPGAEDAGARPRASARSSSTLWLERQLNDPYRRASQARGFSLARRLQADRDRREVPACSAPGSASSILARRPAAGARWRRTRSRRAEGKGRVIAHRPACRSTPIAGVEFEVMDFHDARRAGAPQGAARRVGRRGDVGHGGQRHRPPQDRSSAHRRPCRARRRFRQLGAGAGRLLRRQGAAGRHRRANCWRG